MDFLDAQVNRRGHGLLLFLWYVCLEHVLISNAAEAHIILNDIALVLPMDDPILEFRLVQIAAVKFLIQGKSILLDLLLACVNHKSIFVRHIHLDGTVQIGFTDLQIAHSGIKVVVRQAGK